jgi:hypothetical protein
MSALLQLKAMLVSIKLSSSSGSAACKVPNPPNLGLYNSVCMQSEAVSNGSTSNSRTKMSIANNT